MNQSILKKTNNNIDFSCSEVIKTTIPGTSAKTSERWLILLPLHIMNTAPTMRSPIIPPAVPTTMLIFGPWDKPIKE